MNSQNELNTAASTASVNPAPVEMTEELRLQSSPYHYFCNLYVESYWQAVVSDSPRLREIDSSLACNLIGVFLESLCHYTNFRLDSSKTDIVIDRIYQLYSHYHTADFRLFYNLCCEARFGTLEAYDRENPQVIFQWLRQYDQERTPYLQSAEIHYHFTE